MAQKREVRQKIVLEGEKQYSEALKNASRNIKTLGSEIKAETAELSRNASQQEKNAIKQKGLNQQIREQEKIVQILREELEQVREKYGDNEEAVARYEQKLNAARATLGNMRQELAGLGQDMQEVGHAGDGAVVASKSLADSFGRLGEIGDTVADKVGSAFTAMAQHLGEAVSKIWESVTDLAARSNNMVDLAGYWGTDVTTIQKYAGAVASVSASLEDLNSLVTKINSVDGKKVTELTGISAENYEDQWQYAMAVMDALSQMDTKARNAAGFEIFGRGATKMFDLANDWATVKEKLDTFDPAKGGYGMTEEEYEKMSTLYDQVNELHAKWQSLRDMATVNLFGDLALNLTSNAQGVLDAFLEYFNAETPEDQDAALQKMEDNIVQAFERIGEAIRKGIAMLDKVAEDLKGSDNPTAQALGTALGGLVDGLKWLTEDNMSHVIAALEALATFWLAGKGLAMAAKVAEFAGHLRTIQTYNLLTGGGNNTPTVQPTGGGNSGSGGGDAVTGGGLGALLTKWGSKIGNALTTTTAKVAGGGLAFLATLFGDLLRPRTEQEKHTGEVFEGEDGRLYDETGRDLTAQTEDTGFEIDPEVARRANTKYVSGSGETVHVNRRRKSWSEEREAYLDEMSGGPSGTILSTETEENSLVTAAQRTALETMWDALRGLNHYRDEQHEDTFDTAWAAAEEAFAGQEELFDHFSTLIDQLMEKEDWENTRDLPGKWFSQGTSGNQQNGTSQQDLANLKGLPAAMENAAQRGSLAGVSAGVSGISVTLDGYRVGQLVAPYVSQTIAYAIP